MKEEDRKAESAAEVSAEQGSAPSGREAHMPSGREAYTQGGREAHMQSNMEAYEPSGRKAYEPSGREAHMPSGREAYEPSGRKAYEQSGMETHMQSGREAYAGKGSRRAWLRAGISALIVLASLYLLQRLLVPKYVDKVVEGAFIAAYYEEEKDFNVIFLGDCEVYENFSPAVLWEKYGINSYIRGSAQQYIWQSYYLLEDTLRYETPDVVVFNVLALQYSESQREAYNRMTLEGMEWAMPKVKSILASMKEGEHFLDYVFPILRYHSRWSGLTKEDLQYAFDTKQVSHNGYYMRVDIKAAGDLPLAKPLGDYRFGKRAWEYLDKMTALCREKGIELVLVKAPSLYPHWYREWEEQVERYASAHGLRYYNFLELQEETGIDYNTDTYDRGLHLNLSGAEKLSAYFGKVLSEKLGVPDRRGEAHLKEIWEEKLSAYEAEKLRQYGLYGVRLRREQMKSEDK